MKLNEELCKRFFRFVQAVGHRAVSICLYCRMHVSGMSQTYGVESKPRRSAIHCIV